MSETIFSILTGKDACANTACYPYWCCERSTNGFTSATDCIAYYSNPSGPGLSEAQATSLCSTNVVGEYNPATPWIMPCDPYSGTCQA